MQASQSPNITTRRGRGRPATLSQEKILAAAVEIPIEELTMPRVAEALEVHTSSLYRHFPSRDELVAALARSHILGIEMEEFDVDEWQSWLRHASLQLYDLLATHPHLLLINTHEASKICMEVLSEPVLANLEKLAIEPGEAARLWMSLILLSSSYAEMTWRVNEGMREMEERKTLLVTDRQFRNKAPHVARAIDEFSLSDFREQLDEALTRLIRGFEAALND